ncbi:MAG: TatD family hydrolase [Deltaproteobacteria bacterium]|nr:TatD family hydrolase [Deltaproteobacteria bacterium]
MKIFDTHCHLDDSSYKKDLEGTIKRAYQNDVCGFMSVGTDKKTSAIAIEIANSMENCYASVGFHPHYAKECADEEIEFLKELVRKNKKVKAWGEIGLDFNRMYSPQKDQEEMFVKQLEAAFSLELPVIFHERDSNGRFYEVLKANINESKSVKGVVHCFSGDKRELEKYLDLGLYIGITGIITVKSRGAKLRSLASFIPKDRIVIETDAPYLTPAPYKNKVKRNEPAFVKAVFLTLSRLFEIEEEEFSKILWENSLKLFSIEESPIIKNT